MRFWIAVAAGGEAGAQEQGNPANRYATAYEAFVDAPCPIPDDGTRHFVYFARDRERLGHAPRGRRERWLVEHAMNGVADRGRAHPSELDAHPRAGVDDLLRDDWLVVLDRRDDERHADSEFGAGFIHAPSMRLASWHFTGGASG